MSELVARSLAQRFGRLLLFRELSFEIEEGMVVAVTGPNGSGKSTLLKILAGILQPTEGSVVLTNKSRTITAEERPLHTGFVAPYLQVYGAFSARENLMFQVKARGLKEATDRVDEVLDRVALYDRADDTVDTFSSGMYQRLRLASALLTEPVLLLLDEPFANLDASGRAIVDQIMAEQRRRGTLQVMATNLADYAERCDEVVCIEDYCQ